MASRAIDAAVFPRVRELGADTRIVVLLVALSLARGALYALVNPPFGSPDESGHYDYVLSLYRSGGARVEGAESHQPPLYYWLSLPALALVADRSATVGLLAIRLASALMAAAVVPLAYWTARALCPGERLVPVGAAAFVALLPAYGWIGASANNDNLANLATSAMIYLLVLGTSVGFTGRRWLGMVGLTGVALGAKAIAWPVAAAIWAVLAAGGLLWGFTRRPAVAAVALLGAVSLAAAALLSPPGQAVATRLGGLFGTPGFFSAERFATFVAGLEAKPFVHQFETFWGTFLNDSVFLPTPLYQALAGLLALAALGLPVRLARALARRLRVQRAGPRATEVAGWDLRSPPARAGSDSRPAPVGFAGPGLQLEPRGRALLLLVLAALVLVEWSFSFLRLYRDTLLYGPDPTTARDFALMQGRFLFPVIVPIAFFFAWGIAGLLPRRWARWGMLVALALLLAADWVALGVLFHGSYSWQAY